MVISSAQELAHSVNDRMKLGLTARPWNIYAAADTFWWLVPSTDWPAYRYGKLAFSLAKDVPRKELLGLNDSLLAIDTVFAGFNVEKGYGTVATVVNPALRRKPTQIIDPKWLWFELIDGPPHSAAPAHPGRARPVRRGESLSGGESLRWQCQL